MIDLLAIARTCARWRNGELLKANAVQQPPPTRRI